jgi:hypothetical protein
MSLQMLKKEIMREPRTRREICFQWCYRTNVDSIESRGRFVTRVDYQFVEGRWKRGSRGNLSRAEEPALGTLDIEGIRDVIGGLRNVICGWAGHEVLSKRLRFQRE